MFENRLNVSSCGLVNKLSSTYRGKMVSIWRRIVFLIEVMLNYIRPVSWRGTLELVLAEKKTDGVNHNPLEPINLYFRLII
jgi:hypothetical protein